jgi:Uma2 family endonuclease
MHMSEVAIIQPRTNSRGLRSRMSYEEFLEWDGENQHVEWVDGKVIPMAPISGGHSEVASYLITVFTMFLACHNFGTIRADPFQMKTGPNFPGRAPDILFVAKRNLRRLHPTFLDGPADLVVEIISPGSQKVDRVQKFSEYEQGGVREYWLIDPKRRRAEFYRRGRDGRFRPFPAGPDGIYRSLAMKGFWLKVEWLWDRPPATAVVRELGII